MMITVTPQDPPNYIFDDPLQKSHFLFDDNNFLAIIRYKKLDLANRDQIQDKTICILHCTNTRVKSMCPVMGKIIDRFSH